MIADRLRMVQTEEIKTWVYVGAGDGIVRKLDPSNGSVIWTNANFGSSARGLACDPSGYVYVGTYDGIVRKLNPSNGSVIWTSVGFGSDARGLSAEWYAGYPIQ